MTLAEIYSQFTPGSTGFARAVASHCGFETSDAETKRIGERAGTPEQFEAIWSNESWWTDANNEPTGMLLLYKFSAYNTEAMYGWGDEAEARAYCYHLNSGKEINLYTYAEITDADEIDQRDADADGVNLEDALQEIADDS